MSLDERGHYLDANAPALELLGVSLAELIASPPHRFAIPPLTAELAELLDQWKTTGAEPIVGTTGLLRGDGTAIRVAYAVEAVEHEFRVRMRLITGSPEAPARVFTVGTALREWRIAERVLAELAPGTPEWDSVSHEVEMLRGQYQQLFKDAWPYGETSM